MTKRIDRRLWTLVSTSDKSNEIWTCQYRFGEMTEMFTEDEIRALMEGRTVTKPNKLASANVSYVDAASFVLINGGLS